MLYRPETDGCYIQYKIFGLQAHEKKFSLEYEISQAASKIENFGRLNRLLCTSPDSLIQL
jgi:hypothetical protein